MIGYIIRNIAAFFGIKTTYHVCAKAHTNEGICTVSMAITVVPWLHKDNYENMVSNVKLGMIGAKETPCILSITKLGI